MPVGPLVEVWPMRCRGALELLAHTMRPPQIYGCTVCQAGPVNTETIISQNCTDHGTFTANMRVKYQERVDALMETFLLSISIHGAAQESPIDS